ncbi:MAG: ABC transporter permease [Armatimonadetes bacterium]|nr:ABC transporter permease [Armatimonadota bacterium]
MIWSYAWKGFARRKTRAVLAISGLAISIALLVAIATISRSVREAVGASLEAAGADLVIQKVVKPCPWSQVKIAKDLAAIDGAVVDAVKDVEGVKNTTGVLDLWAFSEDKDTGGQKPTVVAGIDPRKKSIGPARVQKAEGESEQDESCCAVTEGRYLLPTDDFHAMVTEDYARAKNLKLGDKCQLGPYSFEIVALLDLKGGAHISGAEAFIPLKTAQQMYDKGDIVTTIFVSLKQSRALPQVEEVAATLIGPKASVKSEANIGEATAALAVVTQRTLFAISAIVLTLVLFLVAKTALASVAERVSEIGILKATGWRDSDVSRLLSAESLYAGVIGGIVGTAVGIGLAFLYGTVVQPALPPSLVSYPECSTTEAPKALPFQALPSGWVLLGAVVAALVIGSLSGYLASRRAAKLLPAEALRQL